VHSGSSVRLFRFAIWLRLRSYESIFSCVSYRYDLWSLGLLLRRRVFSVLCAVKGGFRGGVQVVRKREW
jgi:hypothetical protein